MASIVVLGRLTGGDASSLGEGLGPEVSGEAGLVGVVRGAGGVGGVVLAAIWRLLLLFVCHVFNFEIEAE